MTGSDEILDNRPNGKFLCGVVEGFYGIPWTSEQRKLLFKWMNTMGMTTYMYAPKDDAKHRAFWRDLYSVEEAENLTCLIEAASANNVTFVYAISPGLDISFSSSKDVQCLKRKCEQVAAFGCKSFALLFDDIDPELSVSDKSAFQSSACAQVSITNELFEHLGQPEFYFCPTEYCTSRAMPSLSSSGYLNTVGSKLLNAINILWTGAKVISKKITIVEMEEVARVFRRPPVIWDNIHANDYDARRVFLGPYDGRSPELIPYLRGVLTNPNCEFEANYIPLHTLGQWSKSNINGVKKDIISENRLSPVASDIKLESEQDYNSDDDVLSMDAKYKPRHALKAAISDWLEEFATKRVPPKTLAVAAQSIIPPPLVDTLGNLNTGVPAYNELDISPMPIGVTGVNDNPSFMQPSSMMLVNSLVDPMCSPERKHCDSDSESDISLEAEPMECVPSAISDSLNVLDSDTDLPKNTSTDSLMQVETVTCTCPSEDPQQVCSNQSSSICSLVSHDDIDLFVSLFYLPFEYGSRPVLLLQDFHWLRANAFLVSHTHKEESEEVSEWWAKSDLFLSSVCRIQKFSDNLKLIPNQAIGYYFFPYLWDLLGVLQMCAAFVQWLGKGHLTNILACQLQGPFTWMTKEYRESFVNGEQEPWCFQGGLQAEFQRMLPISSAHDLIYIRHPEQILKNNCRYRPYSPSDESVVYNICLKTCDDGMDGTEVFPEYPHVIADKLIGALVTLSPEFGYIAEDDEGVMGYVVCGLDAQQLYQRAQLAWTPAMCDKYPKPQYTTHLTPAEEVMLGFHCESTSTPADVTKTFPSVIRLDILSSRIEDLAVPKRLLACALSSLRARGSTGVHVELNVGDKHMTEHYRSLGFVPVKTEADAENIYFGRLL